MTAIIKIRATKFSYTASCSLKTNGYPMSIKGKPFHFQETQLTSMVIPRLGKFPDV
jgi:hypothetical protein